MALLLFSCGQNSGTRSAISPVDSPIKQKSDKWFSVKPSKYYYDFDSSKSGVVNLDSGFVDTFSVRGSKFQVFSNPGDKGDLELQVFKDGGWRTNLTFDFYLDAHYRNFDLNFDGFNDFAVPHLRGSDIYLFDSVNREFHPDGFYTLFRCKAVDSVRHLYFEYEGKPGIAYTNLFQLEGFKQTLRYHADVKEVVGEDEETITLRLYKINNDNLEDSTFLNQKTFDLLKNEFDTDKYWRMVIKKYGVK